MNNTIEDDDDDVIKPQKVPEVPNVDKNA